MNTRLLQQLHAEGLVSDESLQKMKTAESMSLFSLHMELKTMLYTGILLLTTGLGVLVYKNIGSIGHLVVLLFIALLCTGSYWYCFVKGRAFSTERVPPPNAYFDYVLLLACLCLVIFVGYWQYQYHIFGDRFGLAAFVPMAVLFFSAYYFDHTGVLCLAITNLAAWAGISVTHMRLLKENDFNSGDIIFTALVLGAVLMITGIVTRIRRAKAHFWFTYTNFGMHLLFVAALSGMFHFDHFYLTWFLLLIAITIYFYRESLRTKSFYFLLVLTLYAFTGLSYVMMHLLFYRNGLVDASLYLAFLYFIGSGIGLVLFLIRMNKKLKQE